MSSTNLVALVTGATRGIGLETSRQLAQQGVTVLMAGRDEASASAAAAPLQREGLPVQPVVLDVTNTDHLNALVAKVGADFGRLDILVNNAGIIHGESFFSNSTTEITPDALRRTFEVNLFAPVAITQAFLPLLKAAPAARIVNVSSVLGSLTVHSDAAGPMYNLKPLAYDASKAALNMFTVHLAAALQGTSIKANAAHPGWVKTDLGTDAAPMELVDGAKTTVALALIGDDGPNGRFIHLGDELPW